MSGFGGSRSPSTTGTTYAANLPAAIAVISSRASMLNLASTIATMDL